MSFYKNTRCEISEWKRRAVITRCAPTYREDGESVYFKKISLNIEK